MSMNRQDWQKLQWPMVFLILAIVSVTLLIQYVEQNKKESTELLALQTNKFNQAHQRYLTSGQEKDTISQYLPRYQHLIKDGFVGEERRIEWVDALRTIHQQEKLFNINYSIGVQEEYKPSFVTNLGSFKLYRSVMKLELSMLHEGDLLTLVESLDQQQSAPFMLRECEIIRKNVKITTNLVANIHANCELDWLTIHEPTSIGVAQ